MNWGKWIVVAFLFFATFIGGLVTVCMRQRVNLESKDYYKEDLAYQQQLDRISNTNALGDKPQFAIEANKKLRVTFDLFDAVEQGELVLFSPSNPGNDVTFQLGNDATSEQVFDVTNVRGGHYKARMTWSMAGKEFYIEETIFI